MQNNFSVFISYAREDVERCDHVFRFFDSLGLEAFRDVNSLRGGDDWERQILDNVSECSLFVFLASPTSVSKPGMIQQELDLAKSRVLQDSSFRFLCLQIDGAPLTDWMLKLQYLKYESANLFEQLAKAVNAAIGPSVIVQNPGFFVNEEPIPASFEIDGCSYEYAVPSIFIPRNPFLTEEVNSFIRGKVSENVLRMRAMAAEAPDTEHFQIVVRPIQFAYTPERFGIAFEHFLYAGGAHPFHDFFTVNFSVRPFAMAAALTSDEHRDELVQRVMAALNSDSERDDWETEMLRESLARFDFEACYVAEQSGVRVYFRDYVLGSYINDTTSVLFDWSVFNP